MPDISPRFLLAIAVLLLSGCSEEPAATTAPAVDPIRITETGYVNDELGIGIGFGAEWSVEDGSNGAFPREEQLLRLLLGTPPTAGIALFSEPTDGMADAMEYLGQLVPLMEGVYDDITLERVELGGRSAARLFRTRPDNRLKQGSYCIFLRGRAVLLHVSELEAGALANAVAVVETLAIHD